MARRQPWTPHQEASWPLALMKMLRAGTGGSGVIGWQSSCCKAGQGQPTAPHHPPPLPANPLSLQDGARVDRGLAAVVCAANERNGWQGRRSRPWQPLQHAQLGAAGECEVITMPACMGAQAHLPPCRLCSIHSPAPLWLPQ